MIYLALIVTFLLGWNLWNTRNRIANMVVDGDLTFGRAADKLTIHFMLTVCLLQTVWFLWFVIA